VARVTAAAAAVAAVAVVVAVVSGHLRDDAAHRMRRDSFERRCRLLQRELVSAELWSLGCKTDIGRMLVG
jgi:hypothetical protein